MGFMFMTTAQKRPSGNFTVEATCTKGHTVYKAYGDSNTYKCPYCGYDVR